MNATGEGGEDNTVNGGALVLGVDKDGWGHDDDDEFGLSGEGGEPPGESVASLGDECFLAGEICFDFVYRWDDVCLEAVGVNADEW